MGLQLSREDQEIVAELRSEEILDEVLAKRLKAPLGFMAFICSDCDHIGDKFDFLCKVCGDQAGSKRVHLFACHSGGMLLSPNSPTKQHPEEHEMFFAHIRDAMKLKGLDLLVSKCHAPCGAAYTKGLNFNQVLRHTFQGKQYVKAMLPDLRVAVFTQVYHTDGRRRTYSIEMKKWWDYASRKNLV